MKLVAAIRSIASGVFERSRVDSELEEELAAHIRNRAADLERSGITPVEAARRARVEFGGYQRFKEESREAIATRFLETLRQDVRIGLRMLRKSPGFTAVAALTLALGIGANSAVFSVVYTALIRPLPYAQPHRLMTLGETRSQETAAGNTASWVASYPDFLDWQSQSKAFQSFAGFTGDGFVYRGGGEPQVVRAVQSTVNFLSTLGVRPLLGRDFAAGEDVRNGPVVAILSYAFWRRQFAADPRMVGRSIQLDDKMVRIVGVLPKEFEFAPRGNADLWVPMHLGPDRASRRNLRWMRVIARLAPGITPAQARAETNLLAANLAARYPQANGLLHIVTVPLRERIVGQVQPLLWVLFGAVGFVLLIACANIASLLMVRAAGRRREFAIRAAIGCSRGRLTAQLLAESLLLSAAGAVPAWFLSRWGTSLLIAGIPQQLLNSMPFLQDAQANPMVLAFLCGSAILTGLAFGLAPAWQISRQRAGDILKEETRSSASASRTRLRHAIVVAEVAFSLVLLVGATLMVKSLSALLARNPGFGSHNVLTFGVFLTASSYPADPDALRFDREFTERAGNLPGVEGIASNSILPLTGGGNTIRFVIEGQTVGQGRESECDIRDISNGYFSVMQIPLVAGRIFNQAAETPTGPRHVIVNQAWADRYLRGESPIGKRIKFTYSPTQPFREIVGVTGNIADAGLDSPEEPSIFVPFVQGPDTFINYIVRTSANPATVIDGVRATLHRQDPQLFAIQPLTMDQIIDQSPSVFLRRYPSYLIGSFAALALILAMVGLYGLVSNSVSQRSRELGIRIALGAQRGDVLRLVLGECARLLLIGVVAGLAAALGLTQLMRSLLFGVSAADPFTFATAAVVLTLVAALACCLPAMRATRTDPVVALRYE